MQPAQGAQPAVEAPVIWVQTITAGKRGILDSIDFQIAQGNGFGFLNVGLYDGDFKANPLALEIGFNGVFSSSLPTIAEALAQTRFYTFSAAGLGYNVNPGSVFSVVFQYQPISAPTGWASLIVGTGSAFVAGQQPTFNYNQYASGSLSRYEFRPSGIVGPVTGPADIGFRTFVDVAAVPEPTTWVMLIMGFGLIGGGMRRSRRRAAQLSTPLILPQVRAAV